ncbi:MAG: adenylosuccinate lyase [Dehalococcoidia bacterium]|nr:adenylosuccinate lyase [Dehalococcoidia bacterium]
MIPKYCRPKMAAIWSDKGKYDRWLQVESAVCDAWAERGDIPKEAAEKIRGARYNLEDFERYLKEIHHDVISFLRSVADSLGEESRFVHMGLTSYDVVDTALGMQLRDSCDILQRDLEVLTAAVEEKALRYKDTLMMGRTHGVHAEPITFGLKLAGWVDELRRNARRLADARAEVAVGKVSGAVGSHATVPPEIEEKVCARLGLGIEPISTQIVQRDRHARFVTTLAILASSLEKFATEVRHLQRTEVLEVEEPFEEGQAGSSAMPHKRNPEKCERVCGLARVVRGYSVTALENVSLWHERDLTDSAPERIILPDSCLLLDYILDLFTYVMRGLQVYPERMRENLELTQGLVFTSRALVALVNKGLSREKAYKLIQACSMRAWKERIPLRGLLESDAEVSGRLSAAELDEIFDYSVYTKYVDHSFKRVNLL